MQRATILIFCFGICFTAGFAPAQNAGPAAGAASGDRNAALPQGQAAAAAKKWSVAFADYTLRKWPDPDTITTKKWEYNNSIVLHGVEKVYLRAGDPRYLNYIKQFVDKYVDDTGKIEMDRENQNLDLIQPAILTLFLWQETQIEKYKLAGRDSNGVLAGHPRNRLGGFWHKKKYPDEMWTDGIYMAEPFAVKFAALFDESTGNFGQAYDQVRMVAEKTRDAKTGLLYHAWDEDKNAVWAASATGLSPVIWSRGMGWYAMALVDILEYFPADHPARPEFVKILEQVAVALRNAQDPATGVWYQVMDQRERAGNWPEISGSLMFVYALKKGTRMGYLNPGEWEPVARKGWEGAQKYLSWNAEGDPQISDVVQGLGAMKDYESYVAKERLVNSTHGLCAIMMAASEMEY